MTDKKIIWISNIILPEVAEELNMKSPHGGGWMIKSSKLLSNERKYDLCIIFPSKQSINLKVGRISYKSFSSITEMEKILSSENPNLVHVYGTEFKHSYKAIEFCNKKSIPSLLHVQGLVSELSSFLDYKLPSSVKYGFSLRDLVKLDSIFLKKIKYKIRGLYEKKAILEANNILGRTLWDKSIVNNIKKKGNKKYSYFHNNEMLREEFYNSKKWDINSVDKNKIFIAQANYPIKGLHTIIPQISRLKKEIPDLRVFVSGRVIYMGDSFFEKIKETNYERYIRKQIKRYDLADTFVFTGPLSPSHMIYHYLTSMLVVTPSLLENSPNSLSEALYLGVPTVSTYTGGIPSLVGNIENYPFYQYTTPSMFYEVVLELLSSEDKLNCLSQHSLDNSIDKLDYKNIHNNLLKIYDEILKKEE